MMNGKTICTVCNYIYDETVGVPEADARRIRKFEELSDEWRCPDCGSDKNMFQPCSCVSLPDDEHTCMVKSDQLSAQPAKSNVKRNLAGRTLGQIVTDYPELACVFEQYGLDYCCGGKKSLHDACAEKGIKVEQLLAKLDESPSDQSQSDIDWTQKSLKSLSDYIISRYHVHLRTELPRLTELSEKVARVHGGNHPEMVRVAQIFRFFREQLEQHMQKEELILFPGIVGIESGKGPRSFGCGGSIEHPIEMMNREHDDAGEALAEMSRLTNKYSPPADACNTFKVLLHSLATLELEMHQHVHLENNILFPRALTLARAATCK